MGKPLSQDISGGSYVSLPRGGPAEMGVSASHVAAFVDEINARFGGLHGMMLLRRGRVVAETWWRPYRADRRHLLWSLSKSFTSTAVGMGVAEGLLTVEDRVLSFFPDVAPRHVSDNLAAMRVWDLLTMSTGHDARPDVKHDDDWARAFLACDVPHRPGTHFFYNTFATFMLSAILQKLTGRRLTEYLTPRLFAPLGITDVHSEQSPLGIDVGGYGMSLRLEDVAKFGQLYLQNGQWDGRQLVPAAWVADATSAQIPNGDAANGADWNQGYGYQFWRCRHDCYRADGAFGQYCVVMPRHEAVLAINSNASDMPGVLDAAWKHLLPAFDGDGGGGERTSLPPQSVPVPTGAADSPLAARVSGTMWRLEPNDEGMKSVALTFNGGRCLLDVFTDRRRFTIPAGLTDWLEGRHFHDGIIHAIASRGVWENESTLTIKTCFTERPDDWSQTFVFDRDTIRVTRRQLRYGFVAPERPDLTGTRA